MQTSTAVTASEAKAKFSELLERTQLGEEFVITVHGRQMARLTGIERSPRVDVRDAVREMHGLRQRTKLNRGPADKLTIRDLIDEGRR